MTGADKLRPLPALGLRSLAHRLSLARRPSLAPALLDGIGTVDDEVGGGHEQGRDAEKKPERGPEL